MWVWVRSSTEGHRGSKVTQRILMGALAANRYPLIVIRCGSVSVVVAQRGVKEHNGILTEAANRESEVQCESEVVEQSYS